MPDIQMCIKHECKSRLNCYRYTAKPNEFYQAYGEPVNFDGKKCDYFIRTSPKKGKTCITK
jgi:hypothetical protein